MRPREGDETAMAQVVDRGFWNIGAQYPDQTAIVRPSGERISAGELLCSANQIARSLQTMGLKRGDGIAVLLPADVGFFEVYLAAFQIGLYLTPINYHLTSSEVGYILADCEASVFVCDQQFANAAAEAAGAAGIRTDRRFAVGNVKGFRQMSDLKMGPSDPPADRSPGLDMWYTSGTTGRPKGVRRPLPEGDPYELSSVRAGQSLFNNTEPGGVHLLCSPIYHGAPESFAANALHAGQSLVLMSRFDPVKFLELVDRERVTNSHMVPTMFVRLLSLPEAQRSSFDVSSLRSIVHAAAPCPPEVKQQMMAWWGPILYEYYAATEGGGTLVSPEEWLEHPGTVGRAMPGTAVRIYDDEGNEVPVNTPGNVYLKSAAPPFRYFKDDEKTRASYRGDMFSVGDVGYLDPEGWLFLTERKPDIIISGGVNIYPAEIEFVLLSHPGVDDVGVIGVPHEDMGEQVKAIVQLKPDREGGDAVRDELFALCAERLAPYKCPRSIDFVEQLPRTETGKLQRRVLREKYWKGYARKM
jgi:long-chain acyl-CoA synthetase